MSGSDPTSPRLDVVIVSYRSRELLQRCLSSLRAHQPMGGARIFVVDNASDDGTIEMIQSGYPEVELYASDQNLGFSAATNLGARRGTAPYLLALNPDTELTAGALDTALAAIESDPEVAVVGPRLVRPDGTMDHAARRSFPTPISALGHFSGIGRRPRAPAALSAYRAPDVERGRVDAVNGAFMLIRRSAFEEVGGFDERYWMYMEDLDLSYRLAQAGWVSWYEPGATVHHLKGGTTAGGRSPRLEWAFHRGMLRFYRDHYAPDRNRLTNAAVHAGIALKLAASLAQSALRASRPRRRQRRPRLDASPGGSAGSSSDG